MSSNNATTKADEPGSNVEVHSDNVSSTAVVEGNTNGSPIIDPTEKSLGISAYMNPSVPGFSAVVKGRYSDFVVHEVGLNGGIARLTSQDLFNDTAPSPAVAERVITTKPGNEVPTKGLAAESNENAESKVDTTRSDFTGKRKHEELARGVDWQGLESQLSEKVKDETVARNVMAMLESHESSEGKEISDGVKFVALPPLADKQVRKSIHEWVRSSLTCARADTLDGAIRIWHRKFEKEMPNYKAFGNTHKVRKKRKLDWPKDRPNFLKFVLYKENIDTTTATRELSHKGGTKSRIGYAGMKDKRGITSQFCTLYRTRPEQILSATRSAGGGNTRNKGFSVVQVGNFEYVSTELRLGMLNGNRFDIVLRNVTTTPNYEDRDKQKQQLRTAAEALKSTGFINYFGTQRFGKFNDTHMVGIAVLKGDYRKAVDIIMQAKPDERPDIQRVREEWEKRFFTEQSGGKDNESPEKEAACAKRVLKSLNRFMTAEHAILQSLSRKPMDYKRAFSCIPRTLRMMFLHAVQSLVWNQLASYRLDSMSRESVLVGDLVDASSGDVTTGPPKHKLHVVTAEDISQGIYSLCDVVLPLVGKKSQYPTNEAGSLVDKMLQEHGLNRAMICKFDDRELGLCGDYRKVVCQPKDVDFEIMEYHDSLQPLLQTDLMKIKGETINVLPKMSRQGDAEIDGSRNKDPIIAMVVGFTLPSSSYATIALRELMKTPTSSEYQKTLKLEA